MVVREVFRRSENKGKGRKKYEECEAGAVEKGAERECVKIGREKERE